MSTTETIYLSQKGMKELKKQISRLERESQTHYQALREMDKVDGHDERLERIEKISAIEGIDSELTEKKMALESAKLLPRKRDAIRVAIGSVVELIDMQGRLVRYTLVESSIEANPSDGRISIKSPLGQLLIDKQIQDVIEWTSGLRTSHFKLVGIG